MGEYFQLGIKKVLFISNFIFKIFKKISYNYLLIKFKKKEVTLLCFKHKQCIYSIFKFNNKFMSYLLKQE